MAFLTTGCELTYPNALTMTFSLFTVVKHIPTLPCNIWFFSLYLKQSNIE